VTAIHHSQQPRLAEVDRYAALVGSPDEFLDAVCAEAAHAFGVPMATVSFVHDLEVTFLGRYGVDLTSASAAPGLCASAITGTETYVVPDAPEHPVASQHPLVSGSPGLCFYAAAPITTDAGYRIGTVSVMDLRPRHTKPDEIAVLRELAAQVGRELDARLRASER
jgi:sigma-B regulation protein RsbU (phosphoserine phosphatase)